MLNWIVLHAKPHKEDFLWGEICSRGIECFYPKIRVKTVNPRARKVRPYFPGYLFVHLEPGCMEAAELRWQPGATGWVHFGEEPAATVPDSIVNSIRHHVDELNAAGGEAALKLMKHGEAVEILEGPFVGYEAVFDTHISGNERVRVLLRLMKSQQMPVEMPANLLRRKIRN
jgi:transcription antitermination factor NusG